MSNVVTRASYFDPACAPQQAVELRDWLRPARPRTRWGNVARKLDYRPRLGDIRAPTLLLVGRRDPQMPPACAEELAQGIPHAQLVVFDHSGHYPFVEEPEPFWAAVGAFLAPEPVVEARHTGADGRPDARRPERPDRADLSVPGRPRQVALTAEVMAPARQDGGLL
jgi:hypothetical protein